MRRIILPALVILLVLTNALWAYSFIDSGTLLDNKMSELDRQREANALLSALLVELPGGYRIDQAEALIKAKHPSEIIKRRGADRLEVGNIALVFRGDTLIRVGPLEMP